MVIELQLVENSTFLQLSEQEMINLIKDEHLDIKPKNEHKSVHEWCKVDRRTLQELIKDCSI